VSIVNPNFLRVANLFELLRSSSWIWILGLGAFLVLLSGGIDVSFTSIAIASMYTSVVIIKRTGIENLAFAFVIAILVGMLLGAINGLVIHCFRLPTLIVTLGTKTIFIGLMAVSVGVQAINTDFIPKVFKDFGLAHLFHVQYETGARYGFSAFMIPLVILVILTWFILYRTSIGRGIVALGNSEVSAELVGYNMFKIRMFIYVYVGMLSAIAGVIAVSDVAWIAPLSSTIIGKELTIIAAVVIGGTRLSGGEGTIFGTIIGILLVRLFETTLIFIGLSSSWNNFFTGLVLLVILAWTSLQRHYRRRQMLLYEE
jgi:simple sugar transport system permease protein